MRRIISTVRSFIQPRPVLTSTTPLAFRVARKDERESSERYKQGGFHPVNIGEVYKQRYEVIQQLGWGLYSTVWLVRDLQEQHHAAMKVLEGSLINDKTGWDEPGILKELRDRNPQSPGYRHLVQLLDDFVIEGPNGSHISLIMEQMGANVLQFQRCIPRNMPLFMVKRISKHVLLALQYMHECDMVHTDIKGDNILMTGEPFPIAPESRELTIDELKTTTFKLGDVGSVNKVSNRYARQVQPVTLRAPELIISADWGTKADIWNFGCLMYEFARGAELFDPFWQNKETGLNPPETHLAQITGLLGAFPRKFLERGRNASVFFDEQGHLRKGEGNYGITLAELLARADLSVEDIISTAEFLKCALTIDPDERWTASQLLEHSWLEGVE